MCQGHSQHAPCLKGKGAWDRVVDLDFSNLFTRALQNSSGQQTHAAEPNWKEYPPHNTNRIFVGKSLNTAECFNGPYVTLPNSENANYFTARRKPCRVVFPHVSQSRLKPCGRVCAREELSSNPTQPAPLCSSNSKPNTFSTGLCRQCTCLQSLSCTAITAVMLGHIFLLQKNIFLFFFFSRDRIFLV